MIIINKLQILENLKKHEKHSILQALDIFDVNKNGEISFNEIKHKYNAAGHPDVLGGKKQKAKYLKSLWPIQDTYNYLYLCGTETGYNAWNMGINTTYNNDKKAIKMKKNKRNRFNEIYK